jgi:LmbE family N-acetylglucosaminyl deacetylase
VTTVVFFHAHPDDETIVSGGTMASLAAAGHRVVLVTATRGEHGEVAEGFLDEGEALWQRREKELEASSHILGVARTELLGYVDSGMMGTPENDAPGSFWKADVEDAAAKLAAILREESADVVVVYDDNGSYGHPDHIQVHRVGIRAAELAGVDRVYECTVDQDHFRDLFKRAAEFGIDPPPEAAGEGGDTGEFEMGKPAAQITTRIDVRAALDVKRAAMAAHASQISETSFFLSMPAPAFEAAWGVEWYIRRGAPEGTTENSLVDGLA